MSKTRIKKAVIMNILPREGEKPWMEKMEEGFTQVFPLAAYTEMADGQVLSLAACAGLQERVKDW